MTRDQPSGQSLAPTVRPPSGACCARCKRILVEEAPCGCDPKARAFALLDDLLSLLVRMSEDDRRAFTFESERRMEQAFRGDRESRV